MLISSDRTSEYRIFRVPALSTKHHLTLTKHRTADPGSHQYTQDSASDKYTHSVESTAGALVAEALLEIGFTVGWTLLGWPPLACQRLFSRRNHPMPSMLIIRPPAHSPTVFRQPTANISEMSLSPPSGNTKGCFLGRMTSFLRKIEVIC